LLADRAHDGIRAAELGREACRALADAWGEAKTQQALGDLKGRVADLEGARQDYETALPIFRAIHARLGEANTHQGLGNLRAAEGHPDAAFAGFRAAFKLHIEVQDQLGAAADLGYMGRVASAEGRHRQAVLLFEEALSIHRAIRERLGEALDLNSQAEALWAGERHEGALAAWWQAREIFRAMNSPSAARLDAIFVQFREKMGTEVYQASIAALQTHAEERRLAEITVLRKAMGEDPFMQEIVKALRQVPRLYRKWHSLLLSVYVQNVLPTALLEAIVIGKRERARYVHEHCAFGIQAK